MHTWSLYSPFSYLVVAFPLLFFLLLCRPPISTLFPYTTLFRAPPGRLRPRPRAQAARLRRSRRVRARASIGLTRASIRRSEEHTSELQSHHDLVCRLLLEKKNQLTTTPYLPCRYHISKSYNLTS